MIPVSHVSSGPRSSGALNAPVVVTLPPTIAQHDTIGLVLGHQRGGTGGYLDTAQILTALGTGWTLLTQTRVSATQCLLYFFHKLDASGSEDGATVTIPRFEASNPATAVNENVSWGAIAYCLRNVDPAQDFTATGKKWTAGVSAGATAVTIPGSAGIAAGSLVIDAITQASGGTWTITDGQFADPLASTGLVQIANRAIAVAGANADLAATLSASKLWRGAGIAYAPVPDAVVTYTTVSVPRNLTFDHAGLLGVDPPLDLGNGAIQQYEVEVVDVTPAQTVVEGTESTLDVPASAQVIVEGVETTITVAAVPVVTPPVVTPPDPVPVPGVEAPDLLLQTQSELIDAFEPWMTDDLRDYLMAIGSMFSEVELLAFDSDEYEGWTLLLDPDRCPANALPYLAQFVGEVLPQGIGEDAAREWIRDAPNQRRGTIRSIRDAAKRSLTGNRLVSIIEREAGVPDALGVITYGQETPDADQVLRDLRDVVPVDLALNYRVVTGQAWSQVATRYTWESILTRTWGQIATEQPGT